MLWNYSYGSKKGYYLWNELKVSKPQTSIPDQVQSSTPFTILESNCAVDQQQLFQALVKSFVSATSPRFADFSREAFSVMGAGIAMISPILNFNKGPNKFIIVSFVYNEKQTYA